MPRFQIGGLWYEAPNYAAARAMHQSGQPPVSTPTAVPQARTAGPPTTAPKAVTLQPQKGIAPPAAKPKAVAAPPAPPGVIVSYRGDSRSIDEMPEGFTLWVPLTLEDSKNYLKLYLGWKLQDFPKLAEMVKQKRLAVDPLVEADKTANPSDLMRFIIAERNRQRPTISTDLSPGCGGFERGYIHTIHCEMSAVPWKSAVPTMKLAPQALWPTLYLDASSLSAATRIAVRNKIGVQELAYLTNIPKECLVHSAKV